METHRTRSNFNCDKCSYKAIHNKDLTRHKRNMHNEKSLYTCELCDYSTLNKEDLQEHSELAHERRQETRIFNRTIDVPTKCDQCSYRAFNKQDLRRHESAMHEKTSYEKRSKTPPSCSQESGASSTNPSAETSAASSSPPKNFHCPGKCGAMQKSFSHEDELELHMKYFHSEQ